LNFYSYHWYWAIYISVLLLCSSGVVNPHHSREAGIDDSPEWCTEMAEQFLKGAI